MTESVKFFTSPFTTDFDAGKVEVSFCTPTTGDDFVVVTIDGDTRESQYFTVEDFKTFVKMCNNMVSTIDGVS